MSDHEIHTLPNGIRLIHKEITTTKLIHCGFIMDIGSRDEDQDNQGIAHFWEHMAFKGTKKRKAFHIINRLESIGGDLNAYTTKEKITFYATVLDKYFDKAFELLSDITFHSSFPERQIEKERQVILEEMSMYYDAPDDAIQDEFDQLVFDDHPLGMNILGTAKSLKSFHRRDFEKFINENISTERLVFCSVGNIPFKKVLKLAEKNLGNIPYHSSDRSRIPFKGYKPQHREVKRQISQAHCAIGRDAYSFDDEKRLPFFMLCNILGGPGMNSRLNLALREKHGYVYNIDASFSSYSDTGLFAIYFATELKQLKRSLNLIKKELRLLKEKPLGIRQLHTAKEQLMGQLAMSEENNLSLMLMMGKSILDRNKIDTLDEIFERIRRVTSRELLDIAQEMFDEEQLSLLTYIPEK
ncbi:MAG: M16 family metallopeptidase [Candidatus Cyclobacteriaceae bacterium M2_1C_046]